MNKRLEKQHKRKVSRARERVKLSEPDVRTPEQVRADREATRPAATRRNNPFAHYAAPSVRRHAVPAPKSTAKADGYRATTDMIEGSKAFERSRNDENTVQPVPKSAVHNPFKKQVPQEETCEETLTMHRIRIVTSEFRASGYNQGPTEHRDFLPGTWLVSLRNDPTNGCTLFALLSDIPTLQPIPPRRLPEYLIGTDTLENSTRAAT